MAGNNFATGGPKAAARSSAATGNAVNAGEREDLANFISMISRDEHLSCRLSARLKLRLCFTNGKQTSWQRQLLLL